MEMFFWFFVPPSQVQKDQDDSLEALSIPIFFERNRSSILIYYANCNNTEYQCRYLFNI